MANSRYKEYDFAEGWASVSTICGQLDKPFLYKWYGTLGWEKASKINSDSKKIGALIDTEICKYFEDKEVDEADESILQDEEAKGLYHQAIVNFHTVADFIQPQSVMGQQVVYSREHQYIGTFDRLMTVKGKLVLADWKATNTVGYSYRMQLEAYYRALTEMVKAGIIVLKDKDGNLLTEWDEYPLWIVQFPKKEEVNLNRNIIKFKPKDLRFSNFLNLLKFYYGKKQDELEDAPVKEPKKTKKIKETK